MRKSDDNEVRLMLHRALGGAEVVLETRHEEMADELLAFAEQVKSEQPLKFGNVIVRKSSANQIAFLLDDGAYDRLVAE